MANIKITELNSLLEKQDTDVLPIVDISENETKKIKIEDLLERDVSLLAVSETAPAQCLVGDKYFNITTNKIYTATGTNTWGSTGENAVAGIMYIVFDKQRVYAYNGTTLVSVGGGSGGESLPIGTIIPFTSNTIPEEYKLCDGSAISRTTYSDLFDIIGTTYGAGDGSTTFNLPDLRGRVGVGKDSDDTDFDTLGETGGSKELQQHRHQSVYGSSFASGDLDEHTYESVGFVANGSPIAGAAYYNTRYEGTGESGNVQPYQVVNYIIKVMQATPTTAEIVDGYGTSTDKGYSQRYINELSTYSTAEQRVGTWTDGKPIYRKVFDFNTAILVGSSWVDIVDISSLNTKAITDIKTLNGSNILWTGTISRITSGKLQLFNIGISGTDWYVKTLVLEYTKTTD